MGNPSADLDSFISAVVLSYFYNRREDAASFKATSFIPVLNLPAVSASELWRLRPEFGVALRLAAGESTLDISQGSEQTKTNTLEQLTTLADVKAGEKSMLHDLFNNADNSQPRPSSTEERQSLFLVDHNSPSVAGLSDETINSKFNVIGCIDHHVDENYVSEDASPRLIMTGIGSCTSLVVKHLREQGMWPSKIEQQSTLSLQEITKLALAPILIDTANLKATGDKCSDTDREAVRFLESFLMDQKETIAWDRDAFYTAIATAKANSLTLLTMQETFDRDYKAWSERTRSSSGKEINIGVSSLVKSLAWLVKHASGLGKFLDEIEKFATAEERRLGVYAMLTRAGQGKEVVIMTFDEGVAGVIDDFEGKAGELQLRKWEEDEELMNGLSQRFEKKGKGEWKIWWMGDTSKSRKQVGPLLREAVRNA